MTKLLFGTLITLLVFGSFIGCGDEGMDADRPMAATSIAEAPGAPGQTVYPITRTIVQYDESVEHAFDEDLEDRPRLFVLVRQLPDEPEGNIVVRASVIPSDLSQRIIYSRYPIRIGTQAHVHIWENPSTYPAMWLTRDDTFRTVLYTTDELGVLTFKAKSKIGGTGFITLDIGGTTYKVSLIDA